jgi:hypothetical protein
MNRLLLCFLAFGAASASRAATIHFDELGVASPIVANGVYLDGVHIGFSADQAIFNQMVGTDGNAVLSVDPVLSGSTSGTLSLDFDFPVTLLRFDILLQSISTIDDSAEGSNGGPAYRVLLSNGLVLQGGTAPQPGGLYSEGQFEYSGDPIRAAQISFFSGIDSGGMPVGAFGLDNLTVGTSNAPEPKTTLALLLGLALLLVRKWRTAQQSTQTGNAQDQGME